MKILIARPDVANDEKEAVTETMKTGWVTQGSKVEEFEKRFAEYCGPSMESRARSRRQSTVASRIYPFHHMASALSLHVRKKGGHSQTNQNRNT